MGDRPTRHSIWCHRGCKFMAVAIIGLLYVEVGWIAGTLAACATTLMTLAAWTDPDLVVRMRSHG